MKKMLLIVFVMLILGVILALGTVDNTPYFHTDYYSKTRTELDSVITTLSVSKGQLRAGFCRINITPGFDDASITRVPRGAEVPLAGYGARKGQSSSGIHDSLFVKAAAVQVDQQLLVFVSADLLIVPPQVADSVSMVLSKEGALRRDQIYFSATHTHASVGAWGKGLIGEQFAGEENPEIASWLTGRFIRAIKLACEDLEPAKAGSKSFAAPEFVKNRLVGDLGRVNDTFTFLVIEQEGGAKAILGAYAAHATTVGASNMQFSCDFPGYWQRKLEQESTDLAVFFAGTVGSHGPVGEGEDFEKARHLGEALADSVANHLESVTLVGNIELFGIQINVSLPDFHIRLISNIHLATWLSKRLLPLPDEVVLQAARFGDLIWLTTPCDFSGEYALDLKYAMKSAGFHSIISSFNGGYVGYVVPRKYFYLHKYESFVMAWYGPNLGDYFMDLMLRMTDALL